MACVMLDHVGRFDWDLIGYGPCLEDAGHCWTQLMHKPHMVPTPTCQYKHTTSRTKSSSIPRDSGGLPGGLSWAPEKLHWIQKALESSRSMVNLCRSGK